MVLMKNTDNLRYSFTIFFSCLHNPHGPFPANKQPEKTPMLDKLTHC